MPCQSLLTGLGKINCICIIHHLFAQAHYLTEQKQKVYYGHYNRMSTLNTARAAKILKINKKTLMRWDASGKWVAERDPKTDARLYDEKEVQEHAIWFDIRRRNKAHNRLLTAIRKEADRFAATQPLSAGLVPKFHKLEEMKKAYEALRRWEKESREIHAEYSKLPSGFKAKVDPDA